jgi:hypothetical protein
MYNKTQHNKNKHSGKKDLSFLWAKEKAKCDGGADGEAHAEAGDLHLPAPRPPSSPTLQRVKKVLQNKNFSNGQL